MRRASWSDVQAELGVRLPVVSVAVVERVSDGDTEGEEAMLDAWTGLGLDGECVVYGVWCVVCGGLMAGWIMTAVQGDSENLL